MTPSKQPTPILFGNKNQEIDIPDFLKKPQEAKRTISETVLQELLKHEYIKGAMTGWKYGFLTGSLIMLVIATIFETLRILQLA